MLGAKIFIIERLDLPVKKVMGMQARLYDTRIEPYLNKITEWRSNGYTLREVADSLGVKSSTFREYMKKYVALEDAWIDGEYKMVNKLELSAIRAATGYSFEEKKTETVYDKDGNEIGKKVVVFEKVQHSNATILAKCLESMNPTKWKEQSRNEIEIKLADELIEYAE